jgi:hypothetical protein
MKNLETAKIKSYEIIKDLVHKKYRWKGFDGNIYTRELR